MHAFAPALLARTWLISHALCTVRATHAAARQFFIAAVWLIYTKMTSPEWVHTEDDLNTEY